VMNAFEMINLSQGLNLSALFDRRQDYVKRQTRFVSRQPAKVIISTIEAIGESMGLKVHTRSYKTRLEGISANRTGQFAVVLEVFEVAPSLFMVDARKAAGDTLEYHKEVGIRNSMDLKSFPIQLKFLTWAKSACSRSLFSVRFSLLFAKATHTFYKNFVAKLDHIIWKPREGVAHPSLVRTVSC
ncbi:CBL-interacting protein kinase 24-like protein, partial [Drosera capensis]